MATTRDIQEVITKLSSDKVKTRDEGIKLLNTWLEGDRSIGFCKLLAKNSAKVGPDEIPPADTWPFIITLLMKCVSMEISGSKKRAPRLLLAKTLRSAIQCTEDSKFGGKLLLLPVIRPLFSHIWDVTKDFPSFQSEYTSILRLLIVVKEYRYQMRKRIYCNLVIFYMKKVVIAMSGAAQFSSKEELFRFILTFYVLLENSPGDFPDDIRGDLVTGFVDIFSNVRDEGKISRKLMECINIYLIKDGPNLGCQTLKIHSSVQEFLTRYWLTTHERKLKMSFISYARIQVKLSKSFLEGSSLIEQLLDIVTKELDQGGFACTSSFWSDASREEKSIQHNLMELAASVLYWACAEKAKKLQGKRLKMENVTVRVKDGLMKGAYLWNGTVFFLIHNYGVRLKKPLLIDWFEAACQSLQKTLINTSNLHSCDAVLWLLRTLQEFSALLTLPTSTGLSNDLSLSSTEATLIKNCWDDLWTCLLHGLPIFSNVTPVVDVALALLSNMILRDQIGTLTAPHDIWDLMVFKQKPSRSALCLFSCYFSRKTAQGELRDVLYVRRNLLKATLELINFKEAVCFDECIIKLIPAAIFSLCAGCVPPLPISNSRDLSIFSDAYESGDQDFFADIVECSVETLSQLKSVSSVTSTMVKKESNHNVRLPRQIREPLIRDMEDYIAGLVSSEEGFTSLGLADIINFCSLLCNLIYQTLATRISGINSSDMSIMFGFVLKSLAHINSKIEEKYNEIHGSHCVGVSCIFDASGSTLSSLQRLISCALFDLPKERTDINCEQLQSAIQYLETILAALAKLYATFSNCTSDSNELGSSVSPYQELSPAGRRVQVVDVDLDIDDSYTGADTLAASGSSNFVNSLSPTQWKLKLVSVISLFYPIAPLLTWQTLLKMLNNENDDKVAETIHCSLCKNFCGSAELLSELVRLTINMWEKSVIMKSHCFNILSSIHSLLTTGLSACKDTIVDDQHHSEKIDSRNNLFSLGDLVNDIAETDIPDWFDRIKLIDCICSFILFDPHIGQAMIEKLLAMLHDTDYRVRLFLATKIGVLFQTWDGHNVLFHDICSNFGFEMVRTSKEKIIKAKDVLICGSSVLYMETALVTLAHLAFYSEEIENETVFMICAVSALEPSHREMVYALLDNLSKELHYSLRTKYLNEIIGSILSRWVACEVSLLALVEVKDLFTDSLDPKIFMQYCCPWLLPPLILKNDVPNLNLASKVACKPLSLLVKDFFAQIFAVCFAVHCGKNSDREAGEVALQSSILHIGNISEHERDVLIKKNMVSIVSFLLSLSSSCADPALPYFTKDIVVFSVQMVVDGFFEIDDSPKDAVLVDKINIFRPDRVFMFLLEMHNQITNAVHPRHKHNRLTSVESLIQIIGYRATISSTSNYIFAILGKLINNKLLQNQCCNILSKLLELFKINVEKGVLHVLGEQLQFLVSTLVACCISSVDQGANIRPSTEVISLLHQLTVDASPSLSDYVKELEPFPDISCLESIRLFHEDLCKDYSSRDRFLKFVRRSSSLPHRLLFLSLRTLHEKLREIVLQQTRSDVKFEESNCWNRDPEVVNAVWSLVHLCSSDDTDGIGRLLADFISKVGIGDPCKVVFHLPPEANQQAFNGNSQGIGFSGEMSVSEDLLVILLRLLKKYLSDDSAKTVEMTSQTLKGILSTDRGQSALRQLDSYERSLIEVHSKGASLQVVERLLLDSQQNSCDVVSLEDSSLWTTVGKAYESWVCLLVNSLAGCCNDIIIRLCKDILLLKSEVAELLFANVLMDLAGMNIDFCQQISVKVQEHIFSETNNLARSIQILLNAMNSLRIFYVTENAKTSPQSKTGKLSSNAKSRGTSEKLKERPQNRMSMISSWEKVYWLSIDYLIVAKAAIRCGSYFTAIMYVEHWCEEQFNNLTLGGPDFSHEEQLPQHIELLVASVTQINEPDSIYGIVQSHKLTSQLITYEHEGNWSRALDYYDLLVRYPPINQNSDVSGSSSSAFPRSNQDESIMNNWKYYKGLMRSLQKTGCIHVLDTYCHGLISQINHLQHDSEFTELQYEAAWRAGNWDFSVLNDDGDSLHSGQCNSQFNEELHSCLRAFQEGDAFEFNVKLTDSKKELVFSISNASKESTQYIYSSIIKLQILDHLGMAWDLRWKPYQPHQQTFYPRPNDKYSEPIIPRVTQLDSLDSDWDFILRQTQLHLNLLEPFIASRRVMLQILGCKESMTKHLLQSASTLRKASRFSLSTAALHELKQLFCHSELQNSQTYVLGRLEEAKVLRAQGQHEMAVSLAKYILLNYQIRDEASNIYRLVGKWLAESRSSNARTILEQYLNRSVELIESNKNKSNVSVYRQCQTYFQLAHYTDGLFNSYEERLASSEWQSALRLRKHKTKELDALMKRFRSSTKGEKSDYSIKIQELQKQLTMDREEAERLQDDRDSFLNLALEGYERCLSIGGKYDLRVVFRLVSLWFSLYARQNVVKAMHSTVKKVQSYKFIPLVYQIASRLGSAKDVQGSNSFSVTLVSLLRKMAIDHPYHTVFQLLALANGDRIKDKQRSRNSFVVDMDKKLAAENLLTELSAYHGALIQQMKQMVEIYIKLAELETKKEETNKRIPLPRDIRTIRRLELVPVVTATIPIDKSCRYEEGSFPHFNGLSDSVMVMNGINAPKVVECYGSDGCKYRQLAKSGNDDLRQDAVMEQFFGLVNTFLQNHRDTWKRKLGIRTYKVVPFTPSAGVLEWVDGTIPLGEYLLGSSRNGGAHGRYGIGDWSFLQCREHMANEKDKRKAYIRVCDKFRPVMHHFFLERFLQPSEWFESRLSYTRSVAVSSMVGYIVGLGDRHSMNILIDQATAEVIHIDLGVAFEQGLMLKTPERVPFRLTRDIVDGMGVTGVEGVFRRCCEETLSVMRMNKEALLTIIEVFIHDPLYKWALSPLKALQRQKETEEDIDSDLENSEDAYEGNKDAARATLRVKQKLDGYEDGEMRSVQGQVQQLIQDAVDTDRLCQMFPGWGAWL